MSILTYPDPFLRRQVPAVTDITPQLRRTIMDMFPVMYEARGVGLAAIQVGLDAAVFVVNIAARPDEGQELVFINPELLEGSGESREVEGCLSVPGLEAKVRRHERVRVRALDLEGKPFEVDGTGLLARVLQHEMDHLVGKLFVDRVGPAARIALRRRLREMEERFEDRQTDQPHDHRPGVELG